MSETELQHVGETVVPLKGEHKGKKLKVSGHDRLGIIVEIPVASKDEKKHKNKKGVVVLPRKLFKFEELKDGGKIKKRKAK